MKFVRAICLALFLFSFAVAFAVTQDPPITFRQLAQLTASDGAALDSLGYSIAMSGNTLVAGAPQNIISSAGKAYVFVKPAGGWVNMTQTAELTASDHFVGQFFGWRVAISGDTIVVDAGVTDGTGLQGVYVFVKPAGGWTNMTETAKLTLPNGNFLYTVAVSGNTIAAAATEETVGSNVYQGAVYIFQKPKSGWRTGLAPFARLTASDGQAHDYLGSALSISGNALVATAPVRAAYLFLKPPGGWVTGTQAAEFDAPANSGGFGLSAAVSGSRIVVGASEAGFNQDYYGAAFVYASPGGEIMASNPGYYNFFGASVAVSGDLIVVGANGVNVGENQYEGAAYVFEGTTQIAELTPTPGVANEEMGWSVAASGTTIAAGALYATVGSNLEQGEVYVFAP